MATEIEFPLLPYHPPLHSAKMKSIFAGNVNSTTGNWTFYSCSRCCCSRCSCSCCCCYPCWTCAASLVLFIYGQVLHSHWYRKRDHSLLHFAADFLHYDLNWPLLQLQKGGARGQAEGDDHGKNSLYVTLCSSCQFARSNGCFCCCFCCLCCHCKSNETADLWLQNHIRIYFLSYMYISNFSNNNFVKTLQTLASIEIFLYIYF